MTDYVNQLYEAYGYNLSESEATLRKALQQLRASPGDITLWAKAHRVARRHGKVLSYRAAYPAHVIRVIRGVNTTTDTVGVTFIHPGSTVDSNYPFSNVVVIAGRINIIDDPTEGQ